MIYELPKEDVWFPDPLSIPDDLREDDGCFAIGGDLSPARLVEAYSQGIFPWSSFRSGQLLWYCPMQRFVIFPDELHVSHSMRNYINRGIYTTTFDQDFEAVIGNCSKLRIHEAGAWLGRDMVNAYTRMHKLGYAHSVEVWKDKELVGGLYGMMIRRAFMGESMFSLAPNASKFALMFLCETMKQCGGVFIDCQFETPLLKSMGGRYISYHDYMSMLWG